MFLLNWGTTCRTASCFKRSCVHYGCTGIFSAYFELFFLFITGLRLGVDSENSVIRWEKLIKFVWSTKELESSMCSLKFYISVPSCYNFAPLLSFSFMKVSNSFLPKFWYQILRQAWQDAEGWEMHGVGKEWVEYLDWTRVDNSKDTTSLFLPPILVSVNFKKLRK